METMENNVPGQRMTLCINEAFHFLESSEYAIHESTAPHLVPLVKRAISESGIKEHCFPCQKDMIPKGEVHGCHSNMNCHGDLTQKVPDVNCNLDSIEQAFEDKNSQILDTKGNNYVLEQNFIMEENYEDYPVLEQGQKKGDNPIPEQTCGENPIEITKSEQTLNNDKVEIPELEQTGDENSKEISEGFRTIIVVTKNDDCDSGCGDFTSNEFGNDETNISETLKVNNEGQIVNSDLDTENSLSAENEVVIEKITAQTEKLSDDEPNSVVNGGCDVELSKEMDEVVRLRPKSVTSPTRRCGTTQIVSDAFGFLKELDDIKEIDALVVEGRRSSGYKSSNFPDEAAMATNNNNTVNCDVGGSKEKFDERNKGTTKEVKKPKVRSIRRQKSNKEMEDDQNSDDSSDEDTGIYNESFRNSCWICVDNIEERHSVMHDSIDEERETSPNGEDTSKSDDVFLENKPCGLVNGYTNGLVPNHKRTDSTATTASESEFKQRFQMRRKCFVQRNHSQQEYERMSCRVFENEKFVTLEKQSGDSGFGLHILDTHPVIISGVDTGSPASRSGLKEGQILLMVNGVSVLEASHDRIISLVQQSSKTLQLEVASTDLHYIRDMQKPVLSGYLYKQKGSTFLRSWKKRYCVLRQDNCLYYYKNEGDLDPLGAIPMLNYTVSRHQDNSKEFCFKADKYGAKTFYFSVDNRDDMAKWVGAMNEASMMSKKRKESWMDVTSTNVGLPALEVRKAECSGYLMKCGRTTKTWQKRYCILKDACIYHYKNMYSPRAQGMAHLHGYTIHNSSSKKLSFVLKPPEPQMKQFTFAADNETDKNRWIEALSKSIQRWIKVD